MIQIEALREIYQVNLPLLGKLCPAEAEPSLPLKIRQKLTVEPFGAYVKTVLTPVYPLQSLSRIPEPQRVCLGAVCRVSRPPVGKVLRSSGVYRMYLPVYEEREFSEVLYRRAGFLLTDKGYCVVMTFRAAPWLAALTAVLAVLAIFLR